MTEATISETLARFASGLKYSELPADVEIISQCKSGARSAKAQDFLKTVGITNVKNLKGGILEWIDKVDPSQPKY